MSITAKEIAAQFEELSKRRKPNRKRITRMLRQGDMAGVETMLRKMLPDLFTEIDAETPDSQGVSMLKIMNRAMGGMLHSVTPSNIKVLKAFGENYVFQVGDNHIVKLQQNAGTESVVRETLLQDILHERLGGMVPAVTYISKKYQAFAMKKVTGEVLSDVDWKFTEEQKSTLDTDIAHFVEESNKVITLDEAIALKLPARWEKADTSRYNAGSDETAAEVSSRMDEEAAIVEEALSKAGFSKGMEDPRVQDFLTRFKSSLKLSFRREDTHGGNVIIDPKTGNLTALIDFGYASIVPKYALKKDEMWQIAHRHNRAIDKAKNPYLSDEELVNIAREVSHQYRLHDYVPTGDMWLERLNKWIYPVDEYEIDLEVNPKLQNAFVPQPEELKPNKIILPASQIPKLKRENDKDKPHKNIKPIEG